LGGQTKALSKSISLDFRSNLALNAVLGTLYVNPYAVLKRRNDPAISGNADALDIGRFAHIRRCLLDLTPLGGHRAERDLASLGCHVCREHFADLRVGKLRLRQHDRPHIAKFEAPISDSPAIALLHKTRAFADQPRAEARSQPIFGM
jgi:hypothetical protein